MTDDAVTFSKLVDAARSGAMSRRSFLSAAVVVGVGAEVALAELPKRIHSLPAHLRQIWEREPPTILEFDASTNLALRSKRTSVTKVFSSSVKFPRVLSRSISIISMF